MKVRPGQSVAVCVASRGTHDLKHLVLATVGHLKASGLLPFITPAMGSHGGATGEGQASVLRGLGITEDITGVPIKASMDVASMGKVDGGPEVFTAKDALAADHIVVINRVKPHTGFHSDVESGLCKILAVGLGRQSGGCHHAQVRSGNLHRAGCRDHLGQGPSPLRDRGHRKCAGRHAVDPFCLPGGIRFYRPGAAAGSARTPAEIAGCASGCSDRGSDRQEHQRRWNGSERDRVLAPRRRRAQTRLPGSGGPGPDRRIPRQCDRDRAWRT